MNDDEEGIRFGQSDVVRLADEDAVTAVVVAAQGLLLTWVPILLRAR